MSTPRVHPLNGGYDESLLAESPEVSKAAKQEGYNVNLLDEPRPMRVTPTPRSTDPSSVVPKEHYQSIGPGTGARAKVPFWRTRGGMIGLAVLAVVIVGAVVGGAVGGTVGKPAKQEAANANAQISSANSTQPTQPTGSQAQAQGPAVSAGSTTTTTSASSTTTTTSASSTTTTTSASSTPSAQPATTSPPP